MKRNGGLLSLNLPSERNLLEKWLSPTGSLGTSILKKVSRGLTAFEELAGAETGESVKDRVAPCKPAQPFPTLNKSLQ